MSTIAPQGAKWNYQDYANLPEDGLRHEIINGEHFVNPSPSIHHQHVSKRLQYQLYTKIELTGLGLLFDAPIDVQLSEFDIVQPDVTKVGGLSEERRIAWMAQDYGVEFVPHGWNTAVGLAADLHLASAIPNTRFVEYLTGSPFIDELVEEPWRLDDEGRLQIPDRPGLGIKLDLDAVAKYTGSTRWLTNS
jgi:hypothetical protein